MIDYCHDTVVRPSVCDAVHCSAHIRRTEYRKLYRCVPRSYHLVTISVRCIVQPQHTAKTVMLSTIGLLSYSYASCNLYTALVPSWLPRLAVPY